MLPPPAGQQWEELTDFLDLASGFALGVLIFPSQPHALHWQQAIADYLQKSARTLQPLGPYDSTSVHRIAEILCYEETPGQTQPLWAPLCQPPMAPDAAEWPHQLRRALAGMNQTRNLITQRHPRILLLAGTHELLEIAPRIAPDLWSIRRLFLQILPTEEKTPTLQPIEPDDFRATELFADEAFLPTLEETQALLTRSRAEGDLAAKLRALNSLVRIHTSHRDLAEREKAATQLATTAHAALTAPGSKGLVLQFNIAAKTLLELGRFADAELIMRRALAIDEQSYGHMHPEVATDLNNLAALLQDTNRLGEAEPLMRRALEIDEENYGPMHPKVANRLSNLAWLLQETNRLGEAEPLMRRGLKIIEEIKGVYHPQVAILLNNLALLLQSTNRLGEAEPLTRRALAIDEESYGPMHPLVAIRLGTLAGLLQATNRLGEAEPLMRRALEIDEQSYGPMHPSMAVRLNNLATLLQATNRMGEAEPMMRRALEIGEQSYGPMHPNVATSLNNLARLLQATERLGEAEPMMRRGVGILLRFTGETGYPHPNLREVLRGYAGICSEMGVSKEECAERIAEIAGEAGVSENKFKEILDSLSGKA